MQPNPNFMCLSEQLCTLGFHTHVSLVIWLKFFWLFVMCDILWRHSRYVLCISGERYIAKHQAWAGFHSWREVSLLGMGTEINGFKILIPKLFFQNHVKVVKSCVTRNEERVKPGFSSE